VTTRTAGCTPSIGLSIISTYPITASQVAASPNPAARSQAACAAPAANGSSSQGADMPLTAVAKFENSEPMY
jgi:hypothetical protein